MSVFNNQYFEDYCVGEFMIKYLSQILSFDVRNIFNSQIMFNQMKVQYLYHLPSVLSYSQEEYVN